MRAGCEPNAQTSSVGQSNQEEDRKPRDEVCGAALASQVLFKQMLKKVSWPGAGVISQSVKQTDW